MLIPRVRLGIYVKLQKSILVVLVVLGYFDCILTAPAGEIDNILHSFNAYHLRLQFTVEIEKDNRLNFLDITVIKEKNRSLITSWYTKKIWSMRYINNLSF